MKNPTRYNCSNVVLDIMLLHEAYLEFNAKLELASTPIKYSHPYLMRKIPDRETNYGSRRGYPNGTVGNFTNGRTLNDIGIPFYHW